MEGVQVMQPSLLGRFAIFVVFLMASCGCMADDKQQKDLEARLQKSFNYIDLAFSDLEYPHSVTDLNRCIKYKVKECLEVYNLVLGAKNMIKSVVSMKALDTTLNLIEKDCLSKDEQLAGSTCYGAILSFYFYTTPEQDAKILSRIKIYPKKLKNIIFNYYFYWFYNRPNKDVWISAIPAMNIDWENDANLENTLSYFRLTTSELKDKTFIAN